jgi:hypothetical protein
VAGNDAGTLRRSALRTIDRPWELGGGSGARAVGDVAVDSALLAIGTGFTGVGIIGGGVVPPWFLVEERAESRPLRSTNYDQLMAIEPKPPVPRPEADAE